MGKEPLVWHEMDNHRARTVVVRLRRLHGTQPEWPWFREYQQWFHVQSLLTKIAIPTIAFLAILAFKLWVAVTVVIVLCVALYGPLLRRRWQLGSLMEQLESGRGVGYVLVQCDPGWEVLDKVLQLSGYSLEAFTKDHNLTVDRIIYRYLFNTVHTREVLRRKKKYADNDPKVLALRSRAIEAADAIVEALKD